jgi:head-tail adaptor
MIHLLDAPATRDQLDEMLEEWLTIVKVAVDVERRSWREVVSTTPTASERSLQTGAIRRIFGEPGGSQIRERCSSIR